MMENTNKTKKRVIAIIASVLALIIVVAGILLVLAKCNGDEGGKKQQVVVVVRDDKDDGKDDSSQTDDGDGDGDSDSDGDGDDDDSGDGFWSDEDMYASDDISLGLDYDGDAEYTVQEILGDEASTIKLQIYNGENDDPTTTNYRGVMSTVYHPSEYLDLDPHERKYTEEQLRLELTRYKEAGFTQVRTSLWSKWMYTGDPENPWDPESETMLRFYEWCKLLAEYDLEVVPCVMWSYSALFYAGAEYLVEVDYLMPRELDDDGNPIVVQNFGNWHELIDYELQNERLTDWIVTLTDGMLDHGVTNLFGYYLGNEPHEDGGLPEGAFAKWEVDSFSAVEQGLRDAGYRNKGTDSYLMLIGPNQSNTSGTAGLARYFMDNAPQVFDIYSSHFYPTGQSATDDTYEKSQVVYNGYMETVDNHELRYTNEFWLDEYFSNPQHYTGEASGLDDTWLPVQAAVGLIAAMNSGISGINLWQLMDQTWPEYYGSGGEYEYGAQRSGGMPSLYNSETPYAYYYALTLFSKFSGGEGGTVYEGESEDENSGVYTAAVKHKDGGYTIYVVNMTTDSREIDLDFGSAINKTLYRYRYEAGSIEPTAGANLIVADKGFKNVSTRLVDTVPGGSISCYSTIEFFSDETAVDTIGQGK